MGRLQTPQTPTLDLRGTDLLWFGGGPYTAVKQACTM